MSEVVETTPSTTTVLTSENAAAFYAKKLDLEAPKSEEVKAEEVKQEEVKAEEAKETEELDKVEETKEEVVDKKSAKYRFSQLTKQRNEERAAREAAEAKARDLEAKLAEKDKPFEPVNIDGKPDPEKYTDAFKYAEDLTKWTVKQENLEREKQQKEAQAKADAEKIAKTWKERQDNFIKTTPDYGDVLESAKTIEVSNEVRDAILESDVGPQLLYHLAQNPDEAERLKGMTVGGALRALGRLEVKFEKPAPKSEAKPEAEISRAPEPPSTIKAVAAVAEVPINRSGEFTGTPKQWRDLRRAGKIH